MNEKAPPKQSKELATAFRDDALYQQRDAAKFKAVGQRVDYDTFKNMVSVAHLKPLQAPNTKTGGAVAPAWEFAPDGTRLRDAETLSVSELSTSLPVTKPNSEREFEQAWRRTYKTVEQRAEYLRQLPPAELGPIFKVEISLPLLGDIIAVLGSGSMFPSQEAPPERAAEVAGYLGSLTTAGRFGLTSKLVAGKSKQALRDLIDRLEACATAVGEGGPIGMEQVAELRAKYGCPKQ